MRALLLGTALALVACASSSSQGPSANNTTAKSGSNPGLICKEERPTGSNLPREVCRTPEQMADDRREAEDLLRRPPVAPQRPAGGQ